MTDEERRAAGMAARRAALGDAHVDAALARTTPFAADFQDYLTRCAWGEVYTRSGLPLDTRRLLTLVMLVALGHEHEFKLHFRAALDGGVPQAALKEALLQAAVYCGVPAAHAAFRWADTVLADRPASSPRALAL